MKRTLQSVALVCVLAVVAGAQSKIDLANRVKGTLPSANTHGLSGAVTSSDGATATSPGKVDATDANGFCSDAGANDTYTCNLSPAITGYVTGVHYRFSANTANTGAATINLNSLGAKTIKKLHGGITTDLADNDIRAGQWVELVYDGTNMQMLSAFGNVPALAVATPVNGDVLSMNASGQPTDAGFLASNVATASATLTNNQLLAGAGSKGAKTTDLTGAVTTSGGVATSPGKIDVTNGNQYCLDAGSNDTYACNLSPAISAYVTGTHYRFKANTINTGAASINFNAVGAITIKKAQGAITTDLSDSDIRAGQWVDLVYDGTNMQMQSTLGNAPTMTIASGTAALGTSAISSGACATVVTSSGTGIATTDNIMADFNADPTAVTGYAPSASGMLTIIKYPTANTANFKVCNNTASSVTPGAITLNWRVVR